MSCSVNSCFIHLNRKNYYNYTYYDCVCKRKECGKHFKSQQKNKKYCSSECYHKDKIGSITLNLNEQSICDDYINGKTTVELAEKWKCSDVTIGTVLRNNNIKTRNSLFKKGKDNPMYKSTFWVGRKRSETQKLKQSEFMKERLKDPINHPNWRGGTSYEPYCIKFTPEFKERVRDFWGRRCGVCGMSEEENIEFCGRKLAVHHINYDKQTCCNGNDPLFIANCHKCHPRTNFHREYWEEVLSNFIMIYYDGECYLPKGGDAA